MAVPAAAAVDCDTPHHPLPDGERDAVDGARRATRAERDDPTDLLVAEHERQRAGALALHGAHIGSAVRREFDRDERLAGGEHEFRHGDGFDGQTRAAEDLGLHRARHMHARAPDDRQGHCRTPISTTAPSALVSRRQASEPRRRQGCGNVNCRVFATRARSANA